MVPASMGVEWGILIYKKAKFPEDHLLPCLCLKPLFDWIVVDIPTWLGKKRNFFDGDLGQTRKRIQDSSIPEIVPLLLWEDGRT